MNARAQTRTAATVAGATPRATRPAAFALLLALVAALLPGQAAATSLERIVINARDSIAAVAATVTSNGGTVVDRLDAFGVVVADVPETAVARVAADPSTALVTPDLTLEVQSAEVETAARETVAAVTDPSVGAGVGVVLVDTGVGPHPDIDDAVVAAVDLTADQDGIDHHGHGTFLAGLVAGDGTASDGAYTGTAPGAHLVSVKVAGASGETTLSTVLQGLMVADHARAQFNAPVVLLALSGPTGDVPDPIMIVLEMLWSRGSTVVVAAGNTGEAGPGSIGSPGADPYLITVGALDDNGTATLDDDGVPDWSAYGPTPWGHSKPDLIAPGVSVVGPLAPGSTVAATAPETSIIEDGEYAHGSGTSMSAALTAGAAAAVLADDPSLGPDGVKGRLMGSAVPAPDSEEIDPAQVGAGVLNVAAALDSDAGPANTDLPALPEPAVKPGQGHGAANAPGNTLTGPGWVNGRSQAPGQAGKALHPAGWSWTGWSWTGWSWTGWSWTDADWTGWSWTDDGQWTGWSWTGWSWTGWSWTGEPAGWSWTDAGWTGWSWTDESWAGWSWTEADWAGWSWTGWSWTGWSWTGWSWTGWSWASVDWS